jgi:hypothetical protein
MHVTAKGHNALNLVFPSLLFSMKWNSTIAVNILEQQLGSEGRSYVLIDSHVCTEERPMQIAG